MTHRLLNGQCKLHDVQDVEGLCGRILDTHLRRTRAHLDPHDREDALTFLIGTVYALSLRWRPEHGIAFSTYAWRIGKLRIVDFYRQRFGDSRFGGAARENIDRPLYLDGPADGSADAASLGETLPGGTGDPQGDRLADLAGLFGGGSRVTAEDTAIIRRLAA